MLLMRKTWGRSLSKRCPLFSKQMPIQSVLLGNYFKFDNTDNVMLFPGIAEDGELSNSSARQNEPDIKHGKETMAKEKNAVSEVKSNII